MEGPGDANKQGRPELRRLCCDFCASPRKRLQLEFGVNQLVVHVVGQRKAELFEGEQRGQTHFLGLEKAHALTGKCVCPLFSHDH
jgi:hypothetical protein